MQPHKWRIVVDENIPYAHQAFGMFGSVDLVQGRGLRAVDVADADVLLIRSVTQVNAALLTGSAVRFVGTATSGIDHVDTDYLSAHAIAFASAPGSNATSVAEYVLSALFSVLQTRRERLAGKVVGIIGCGQVGSRLSQLLTALGCHCLHNDPPLQRVRNTGGFVSLDAALKADIVTLHVPLTLAGQDRTAQLIDAQRLAALRSDVILVNAARGGVIDELALLTRAQQYPDMSLILDCWADEPAVSLPLLRRASVATPHIAGYSMTGKVRATWQLHQALATFLGHTAAWQVPPANGPRVAVGSAVQPSEAEALLCRAVFNCYDARRDDNHMRDLLDMDPIERVRSFDRLRKHYPVRYEFADCELVTQDSGMDARALQLLAAAGFGMAKAHVH